MCVAPAPELCPGLPGQNIGVLCTSPKSRAPAPRMRRRGGQPSDKTAPVVPNSRLVHPLATLENTKTKTRLAGGRGWWKGEKNPGANDKRKKKVTRGQQRKNVAKQKNPSEGSHPGTPINISHHPRHLPPRLPPPLLRRHRRHLRRRPSSCLSPLGERRPWSSCSCMPSAPSRNGPCPWQPDLHT